jgi:hypothetical protein
MHITPVRYTFSCAILAGTILVLIKKVDIENDNLSVTFPQFLYIDDVIMKRSFPNHTFLYEILRNNLHGLSMATRQRKKTCKRLMSSKKEKQKFLSVKPMKLFAPIDAPLKISRKSSSISLNSIRTLIGIFEDFDKLENCRSDAQKEWLWRLSTFDCQSRRPRDRQNRSFYHAQIYHNQKGWKTLHSFSTGIAVQGTQRSGDVGYCDLAIAPVLPSLYNSSFRNQLAETNAIIALGLSANCLPKMDGETEWISTGSWKSDKLPAPCDHLRQLDLLQITLLFAKQINVSLLNSIGTVDGIIWNNVLGEERHVTEGHTGMASLTAKFFEEIFQVELSNITTSRQREEWMFYGLPLPCCSHFALRRNAFKTLAKLHVISLIYMIIHYGEPYSCPWPTGDTTDERCWSFLNERLSAVFLRILTNHVDIIRMKQCDAYNKVFGKHRAIDEFRAIFHSPMSLFTSEGISHIYNHMKCEIFSVII